MNFRSLNFIIVLLVFGQLSAQQLSKGYPQTDRTKTNLNLGWKFHLDEVDENPGSVDFDDNHWEKVAIPHSLKLVSYEMDSVKETWVQETFLRDIGWYRKTLKIDADPSKKVFLEFEGVHNAVELWVNGQKTGSYDINGYVPFHFDITDYVKFGADNVIAIKADNRFNESIAPDPHRTDYIKFGGLYRDLYLVTTNKLHVNYNWEDYDAGVHITTPTVNKKNGTVSIKTTVKNENDRPKNCKIETRIIDADGYVIKKLIETVSIHPNDDYTFRQSTVIEDNYNLWSPDQPYLYRVNSIIHEDGRPVDFVENTFGFREFKLVKGKGFVLNGEPIFLIGANRHQNYPIIGDAVPNSFHYNEALQYKQAGMNIIRLSHYTQDDAFIKACDELGMLVYEEPSTWIEWGDDLWFSKLESATRTMVRNHRNHPSIVFWGAGINHRGPVPRMQLVTKEEDPFRLTASASSPWNGVKDQGVTDIHATMDYRRTEFPESAFTMVMEHGSSIDSEVNQFHISRYKSNKNNFAAIAWLGADYNHLQPSIVGAIEGIWERDFMTTYGILSGYRLPKPVYYWYQSELVEKPIVHIGDETASKNGKIRVFSNCQDVELYHNGQLIARQRPDNNSLKENLKHPSFTFLYNWKEGNLKAIGYINGQKVTEFTRNKEGGPSQIKINFNINDQPFYAGGSDLRLVHASVLDENGEVVTSAENKIEFDISGAGELVDNGEIDVNPAIVYNGFASIYIKGTEKPGKITITAKSNGLNSATATVNTIPFELDELAKNAIPIYDYPIAKVDIGGEKQLVQFDWQSWTGTGNDNAQYDLKDFNAQVKISSTEIIKWFGNAAMQGDLSFVGTDGLYVENGVLKMEVSNLGVGNYLLETFHHTRRSNTKMTNNIEVIINDAIGTLTKKADDHIVDYYIHENTGERQPLSVKSKIKSDGKSTVMIEFRNLSKGDMWLSGFALKQVK